MVTISDRVKALRMMAGVGARETDRLLGKSEGTTSMLERRTDGALYTDTAALYAATFGVSLDWLVRGDGPEPDRAAVLAAVEAARARVATPPHTASDFAPAAPSDGEAA